MFRPITTNNIRRHMMEFVPTKEQKRTIAKAKKELETKHKKKVKQLGAWCLRFHHKKSYFDYWPTTGKWVFAKGTRSYRHGAGNRYNKASSVEILMKAVTSMAEFAETSREKARAHYEKINAVHRDMYLFYKFEFWLDELRYPGYREVRYSPTYVYREAL